MMETKTEERRARRWVRRSALLGGVVVAATGCFPSTWGVKASYRNYITGPIGDGAITAYNGAIWAEEPSAGTGKGPFEWQVESATFDQGTGSGTIQFNGTARTQGHPHLDGYLLDLSLSRPRLVVAGATGTLYVDVNHRPFVGPAPDPLPTFQAATDVAFATVDLSGEDYTPDGDGNITISDAPTTGIPAAMDLVGFDDFYGSTPALDPITAVFNPTTQAPAVFPTPRIIVSHTTDLDPGDVITVWGSGFSPFVNGTRPPLAGQPSGVYAIFGKFGDPWKPSAGAPSSARTVIDQKWALLPPQAALLGAGTVPVDAFGNWKATLTVGTSTSANPNDGVYVYPGSGGANPAHELSQPVTLDPTP